MRSARHHSKHQRLVVALGVASAAAFAPQSAFAGKCTIDRHCYGDVQSFPGRIDGVAATITPRCLGTGGVWPAFVTDEIWLTDSAGRNWVEAGYIQNNAGNINGLGGGRMAFWAERTPRHEFVAHGVYVKRLTPAQFMISAAPRHRRYTIAFDGHNTVSATDPMRAHDGIYGSETTTRSSRNHASWRRVRYHGSARWVGGVVRPLVTLEQPLDGNRPYRGLRAGNPC
ncbi:MAG TPA: hypothetical protein VG650_11660 [Mycobacteriales bacterium]|nr:hypothetical protein [Mycobacteriales bacterium]